MKQVKLYPTRRGLIVRDPRTRHPLSDDGEVKTLSGYWLRRMRERSVSEKPLAPAAASAAENTAPAKNRKQTETDK